MKPKLRDDVEIDLGYMIRYSIITGLQQQRHPYKNCLNCNNFNEKNELCKLANSRPPARVIAYGCPKHDDMYEVPF